MVGRMIARAEMRSVALVLFFVFCQVIVTMCALPDLSLAEDSAQGVEGMAGMTCPMDGTIMCPPSATSSPERQVKNGASIDFDRALIVLSPSLVPTAPSVPMLWSWSSAYSIVPLSIESSSVLRI